MENLMIEADNLRRAFKETEAVAGVSFSVQHGEVFGLLGPNGAGKTTTIRMLSSQIDPSGGRATVAGCDVVKDRARLKTLIGVVFEEQNLYERLSTERNLRFNCWLYNLPESRIEEGLDLVHLRERAKDPVHTYSQGMKQRLMIARALLLALTVGTGFISLLLLEEKEKKTLRMLLVTPASFGDILAGKLLVVLAFQLATTCAALAILGGFSGNLTLVLLYVLLSAFFSLSLGAALWLSVQYGHRSRGSSGIRFYLYIVDGIFVGQLGQMLGSGPVLMLAKLLPTYYLADGVVNASQNLGSWGSNLFDIGVILVGLIVLLAISAWALRRQSAELALI